MDSLETWTDVGGWLGYLGQVDKERRLNGPGKQWWSGGFYMGGYKENLRTEGKEYKLETDHTYTVFHVKYD